jgi:hypothetical protein
LVDERLRQAGYSVDEVRWVVNSHLHFDHAGRNAAFPAATEYVRTRELEWARTLLDKPSGILAGDLDSLRAVPWDYADTFDVTEGLQLISTPGHTPAEITAAIGAELDRLKNEDVTPAELQSIKTRVKAGLLRELDSNSGLALQLAEAQTQFGDWRELFRSVDRIDKVTASDIRRVANATFTPNNRTIAYVDNSKPAAPAATTPATGGAK